MHWHDFGTDFSGCWKVSNFTRFYRCTDMTLELNCIWIWNHSTWEMYNGHNSAIHWSILIILVQTNKNRTLFVPCGSQWNHTTSWPQLRHFLTDFGSFWYKWTPKDPLLSHLVLNGIMQPLLRMVDNLGRFSGWWFFGKVKLWYVFQFFWVIITTQDAWLAGGWR